MEIGGPSDPAKDWFISDSSSEEINNISKLQPRLVEFMKK